MCRAKLVDIDINVVHFLLLTSPEKLNVFCTSLKLLKVIS